jgi:pimeloyl-ACP methyl ester carboxylesterase
LIDKLGERKTLPDISEQSPEETIARLDAAARRVETPCGDGAMVWRVWGAGAPVILLHGSFGSWLHWVRNIPALAERYRVIVPDVPGHGDSAVPPVPDSAADIAAVLVDGLEAVLEAGEGARLVGFSFGSRLACQVAAQAPARIDRLLLLAPAGFGFGDKPPPGLHRQHRDMTADERAAVHRHNLGIAMIADPGNVDDLAIHIQTVNARAARFRMSVWSEDELLNSLRNVLPDVRAPLCAVLSDRDAFSCDTRQQRVDALRALRPDADIRILEGPGHWSQFEAPERVNALLLDVLAGDGPPPSTGSG